MIAAAAMPTEIDIVYAICGTDPPDAWLDDARRVLALFAPILAEKEAKEIGWAAKAVALESRALAAEAALATARAEERDRCAVLDDILDPNATGE